MKNRKINLNAFKNIVNQNNENKAPISNLALKKVFNKEINEEEKEIKLENDNINNQNQIYQLSFSVLSFRFL